MRVIAGLCKGRKLHPPKGFPIRPTADHLRESLFNILVGQIEGARVLDLFAGTGSLGIEALSRGARSCVFIDKSRQAVDLVRRNLAACRLTDRGTVLQKDILRGLEFLTPGGLEFDLVFADPPYERGYVRPVLENLNACNSILDDGAIVVEHSRSEVVPEEMTHLWRTSQRRYGKTLVSFYEFVL
jgi:16S rRNA (guanine966-N2)-methyltransferase